MDLEEFSLQRNLRYFRSEYENFQQMNAKFLKFLKSNKTLLANDNHPACSELWKIVKETAEVLLTMEDNFHRRLSDYARHLSLEVGDQSYCEFDPKSFADQYVCSVAFRKFLSKFRRIVDAAKLEDVQTFSELKTMLQYEYDYLIVRYDLLKTEDKLATVFFKLISEIETLIDETARFLNSGIACSSYDGHKNVVQNIIDNIATFMLFEGGKIELDIVVALWKPDGDVIKKLLFVRRVSPWPLRNADNIVMPTLRNVYQPLLHMPSPQFEYACIVDEHREPVPQKFLYALPSSGDNSRPTSRIVADETQQFPLSDRNETTHETKQQQSATKLISKSQVDHRRFHSSERFSKDTSNNGPGRDDSAHQRDPQQFHRRSRSANSCRTLSDKFGTHGVVRGGMFSFWLQFKPSPEVDNQMLVESTSSTQNTPRHSKTRKSFSRLHNPELDNLASNDSNERSQRCSAPKNEECNPKTSSFHCSFESSSAASKPPSKEERSKALSPLSNYVLYNSYAKDHIRQPRTSQSSLRPRLPYTGRPLESSFYGRRSLSTEARSHTISPLSNSDLYDSYGKNEASLHETRTTHYSLQHRFSSPERALESYTISPSTQGISYALSPLSNYVLHNSHAEREVHQPRASRSSLRHRLSSIERALESYTSAPSTQERSYALSPLSNYVLQNPYSERKVHQPRASRSSLRHSLSSNERALDSSTSGMRTAVSKEQSDAVTSISPNPINSSPPFREKPKKMSRAKERIPSFINLKTMEDSAVVEPSSGEGECGLNTLYPDGNAEERSVRPESGEASFLSSEENTETLKLKSLLDNEIMELTHLLFNQNSQAVLRQFRSPRSKSRTLISYEVEAEQYNENSSQKYLESCDRSCHPKESSALGQRNIVIQQSELSDEGHQSDTESTGFELQRQDDTE